ncbi:ARM repeat-containing protein [Pleurotus eryngii]|uniref:ARM repeat-containing protein n=1 Tax=Pleurotus eryngii TaxID=5323 RepID=A0A9P5ZTM8_PLEER|nr:ARM repeat-containing protein [Pleurotus eryngii]
MDLQTLSNLFATTFSPDPNVRKAGELDIRKVANEEGIITALLQIIAADSVDPAIRQACTVWLKNRIITHYNPDKSTDRVPIAHSDRQSLKAAIFPLLSAVPSHGITAQLSNTLKTLVINDYPDNWPGLLAEVKRLLASSEVREVHAGCVASLEIVRAFRFRQKSDILSGIVVELMPSLVQIATQMLQSVSSASSNINPSSQEIPTMLHLILKTYKTSIIVNLSTHQQSADSLVPWGQLLFAVINFEVPQVAVPADEEERERCEWWKVKKWAYGILFRLFHRFGNPSQLPSTMKKEYKTFADHFVTMFAPEILNIYLRQVELFVSGRAWLSKKCQYQIFQFFTECVKPKSTWKLLKPHFESLVSSFVFPQLSFTTAKEELWTNDPVDFVRTSVDEYENYATPVSSATTFLFSLVSNRTKTTLMPILAFVNTVLKSNPPPAQRFGVLNMTAALVPFIMRHPKIKLNMEQFVLQHVTNEFSAPEPYLRAIACEIIGTLTKSGLEWSNDANLDVHFRAVANALDDAEFPVRVQAALALTQLVVAHESVRTAVAPQVGKVIQDLLKLSDDTDLDILNRSMEVMVEQFQTELLPVAAQLTARLCESYLRLCKEIASQEETGTQHVDLESLPEVDEDKTFAAMGVSKTISTVISSIESSPEILAQVQEVVIPVIMFTLQNKLLDLFDNAFDLVDSLTFKSRAISPNMWPIFEETYKLFKAEAVDFLDEMLPSLDNFVSFGVDMFKSRPDYRQMVLDIYATAMTSPQLGENDRVNGSKLAESILLNLRGTIDDALQPIIVAALDHMDICETNALRLANLEVLVNAVLYNPQAALHLMESSRPGKARAFFDQWFAAISSADTRLPRVHDKKLSILALCALMEMEPVTIPPTLTDGWPTIVSGALKIFKGLPQAIAQRKELEDDYQNESDDELSDDERLLNLEDNDEDVWDEDSEYLEMLARESARLREKNEKKEAENIDDDDVSSESDIEEELGFISPLDNVDPYSSFQHALTTFQMKNPSSYQVATTSLDVEQQTLLMEIMQKVAAQPTVPAS